MSKRRAVFVRISFIAIELNFAFLKRILPHRACF